MEIKAFNPIILFCCLFGIPDSTQINGGSPNYMLLDFVDLYANPRKNPDAERGASVANYLLGVTADSNRGYVPNAVKEFNKNFDIALANEKLPSFDAVKDYFDSYSSHLLKKHNEYVEMAISCDDISQKHISEIPDYNSDKVKWLLAILRRCLPNKENYFGNKKIFESIFTIIKTAVDNEQQIYRCREILKCFWEKIESSNFDEDLIKEYTKDAIKSLSGLNPRNIADTYFKKICSIGRFEKYWSEDSDSTKHFIKDIDVSLKTSGENGKKSISFEEVLFPSDKSPEQATSSISLCGKGGIGKTFLILRVMETIFKSRKYNNIIPLYIALQNASRNYNGNVFVALYEEIRCYCGSNAISESEFEDFLRGDSNRVIVFADGMNEVTGDEERSALATSLTKLSSQYGTRICVSSRQNHVNMFNRLAGSSCFEDAEVNKLTQPQIEEYLTESDCKVSYSGIEHETRKLLETPQGLAMYSALIRNDSSKINTFTSLGGLILAYSDLLLDINRDEITDTSTLEFEETLEEIAYLWVKDSRFEGKITPDQKKAISSRSKIKDIFTVKSDGKKSQDTSIAENVYEFSHQNFRDLYCGRFLARRISEINVNNIENIFMEYFNLSNSLVSDNDEVLELTSAFVADNVNKAIDALRDVANREDNPLTNYDYPLSRLIRIHAFKRNNNISELDLSNLDLREITVSGYQLYSIDKSKSTVFNGAVINTSTFLKNGLDSASSAITKYEYKGKTYVVAFARTSIAVIDVAENQVQVVRNLPSNKWINCCYATEKNGEPIIYLGNENGVISEFYPHMLYVNQRYVKQDLPIENVGEILSITGITLDGEEYILFSSVQKNRGVLSAYKKYQVGANKFIKKDLPNLISLEKYKLDYTNCKMTYSPQAKLIFVSFIDRIYVYNCKKLILESCENELQLYLDKEYNIPYISTHCGIVLDASDQLIPAELNIRDIYACDFIDEDYIIVRLFVNRCNRIDVFELELQMDELPISTSFKAHLLCSYDPANENSKTNSKAEYTKFSCISIPNGEYKSCSTRVLVGIEVNKPYETFYRFYELYCSDEPIPKKIATENVGSKYNGYVTHTGVYYQLANSGRRFLATVSDYRTIEVDCIGEEDYPKRTYYGAYNGVHYIDCSSDYVRIVCGNYDGYIVELEKQSSGRRSNRKSKWGVSNSLKLHKGWVWKALYLDKEGKYIVSCGYDGKFILTSKTDNDITTSYVINADEKLLDFCISKNNSKIYVISESGTLYTIELTQTDNGIITLHLNDSDSIIDSASGNLRTIAIDDNDDHPILFYNEGQDTLGHIVKYSGKHIQSEFVNLNADAFKAEINKNGKSETKYAFIRQMRFVQFEDYSEDCRYLVAVGDLHTKGIVLIAGYTTDSSDDIDKTKMIIHDSREVDGKINDFTVTKYGEEYVLWLAHKNFKISAYKLIYTNGKIRIQDFIMNGKMIQDTSKGSGSHSFEQVGNYSKTPTHETEDQPMCLRTYAENSVLIGLLNGDVLRATLHYDQEICQNEYRCLGETIIQLTPIIHTHADLGSIYNVELKNCHIEDKEDFQEQLNGYFKIE